MKKYSKALYVIDMVNGFVREGVMHDNYIEHTIDEQVKLIESVKKQNQAIALVGEWHSKDSCEFTSFPAHCIKDTNEAQFINELRAYEDDSLVYRKNSTNAIFAPGLLNDLDKMENLNEVIVCGCCTDICVLHFVISLKTYFNEHNRKVKIFVVKDATETYSAPSHDRDEYNEIAYKLMKQNGIEIVKDLSQLKEKERELSLNKGGR